MASINTDAQHTNYTSLNPLIGCLMHRFLQRVEKLLVGIDAKTKRGLDAGCGEGHMLQYLRRQGVLGSMVATDINTSYLQYAHRHFSGPDYCTGDLGHLPFADHSFEYVLATEVLEHVPHPADIMQELRRVARKCAPIIISVPFEPLFHWGNLLRGKYWERGGRTPDHKHFWHRSEFRQFLEAFVVIETEYSFASFPWLLYACRFK